MAVLESILVTRCSLLVADKAGKMCLSFTSFFFSCGFPCCLFSSHARNEGGMQAGEKEQGQFQTARRPGSELMCSSGEEPHAPGVGNQSKHSCRCTDLFVSAYMHVLTCTWRVFVCVGLCILCKARSGRRMEDMWVFGKTLTSTIWTTA